MSLRVIQVSDKQRLTAFSIFLFAVTITAYMPVAGAKFIWDDDDYVLNNPTLRSAAGLKDIWLDPTATPQYYPMVHTSFWIEHALWGLDPRGYHLVNVALHAFCAIGLLRILSRLRFQGAFLAALIFAVHPVMTESVAWVTERKNVLSLVFYLGSMWALLGYFGVIEMKRPGSKLLYALALAGFVGAILSKSVTCSLPAAAGLALWWKRGRLRQKECMALIPFLAFGFISAAITVWLEKHHVGAEGAQWDLTWGDRMMIASRAPWFYLGKLLWPGSLSFIYPRWSVSAWKTWELIFIPGTLALIGVLLFRAGRWGRGPLALILFFGGTLFPALGFLDVFPFQYSFVADHFQYHASIGVILGLAWMLARIELRTRLPRLAMASVVIAILVLQLLVFSQSRIYEDQEELWTDTLRKSPNSLIAHNNLGAYYASRGRIKDAALFYEKGFALDPNDDHLRVNLASAYVELGRVEEAIAVTRDQVMRGSTNPWLWEMLGRAYQKSGRKDEALDAFQRAIQAKPDMVEARCNLAVLLVGVGQRNAAREILQQGLLVVPNDPLMTENLRRIEGSGPAPR